MYSSSTFPTAPYTQAPYLLHPSWCIGDSIDIINANTAYFENNKVDRAGDTMTGPLTIESDLIITDGGVIDLNCGLLKNFGVEIKTINITPSTQDQRYVIQHNDCGKVIVVSSTTNAFIGVPSGLPIGFNIMIVSNTSYNVTIQKYVSAEEQTNNVRVVNVVGAAMLGKPFGICNFIIIAEDTALISGDLT
jgi:hypothetical protein